MSGQVREWLFGRARMPGPVALPPLPQVGVASLGIHLLEAEPDLTDPADRRALRARLDRAAARLREIERVERVDAERELRRRDAERGRRGLG